MNQRDTTISPLRAFYRSHGRMPSYREIAELFHFKSKNAAFRLAAKLIKQRIIGKDATGRLIPLSLQGGISLLGHIHAGFPTPVDEESSERMSLDEFLIEKPDSSFLVKVEGDSMIDAGIRPGDFVVVERGGNPKEGDIVVAHIDNEWTLKYFSKIGGKICLTSANTRMSPLYPSTELRIAGIVKSVARKY